MRVIIVDDHPVVRAGLRAVLEGFEDMEVTADFETPDAALSHLEAHHVDLVLMDLRFGRLSGAAKGMDGIDAVAEIRRRQGPPVLVVTTYGSDPEILGALAAGAAGYILKDADVEELRKAVFSAASGQRFLGSGVSNRAKEASRESPALTARELQVLRIAATGATNAQIARRLTVTDATVKTHLSRVFDKLGVRSRTAAVAHARASGILEE